jgi:hypothetical protein
MKTHSLKTAARLRRSVTRRAYLKRAANESSKPALETFQRGLGIGAYSMLFKSQVEIYPFYSVH